MMLMWNDFVEMLGCQKMDERFIHLSQEFNELPKRDESILGDREYYSFIGSGILFLLDNGMVDQISFYIEADEGFSEYKGDLPLSYGCSESEVIHHFGVPSSLGGGAEDALLGYMNRWIKYEEKSYAMHLQFNKYDKLCRVTLMR
ncbi:MULTISPECIES: hypothetical protein [unclassified Enterobacter]|uniref:hypothetical protein n=1 Tax=unclassified Enterobacter TaxID=2608935 RepID=UPI0023B03DD5|nr:MULTISPECIES: hypothetical protein [unclassified Enterobacter]MEA3565113.1 hypothetical protein [Enterobacter sp. GM-22]MEA3598719.1 hypothetical protein [Enterobacter sp. GM-31]